MLNLIILLSLLMLGTVLNAASPIVRSTIASLPAKDPMQAPGLYATIATEKGDIIIKLFEEQTPLTVMSFIGLAEGKIKAVGRPAGTPFYDGLSFHRVSPGLTIQAGDPSEIVPSLQHSSAGTVGMSNSGHKTNGSQFYITKKPAPWLNGNNTIFGHVVSGQQVVNKITRNDHTLTITIHRVGPKAKDYHVTQGGFSALRKKAYTPQADKHHALMLEQVSEIKRKRALELYPKVSTTASGLMYEIKDAGEGPSPVTGDQLQIHYSGKLLEGPQFGTTHDHINRPAVYELGIGKGLTAWEEALAQMKAGEIRTLIVPPELGYGPKGAGAKIPPNSWLVYNIELLIFRPKPPPSKDNEYDD